MMEIENQFLKVALQMAPEAETRKQENKHSYFLTPEHSSPALSLVAVTRMEAC